MNIRWDCGSAHLHATAAMLSDLTVATAHGDVRPLAAAPWRPDDPDVAGEAGHLRVLGGDFVGLPFGSAGVPADAPPGWPRRRSAAPDPPHGSAADADWRLRRDPDGAGATAVLTPRSGGVERMERRVRGVSGRARIEMTLDVTSRVDHRAPIGLHPILALPEAARIEVDFAWGRTWPGRLHPRSRPLPDAVFTALDGVPTSTGRADLAAVPATHPTEEVVQLAGARSPFRLRRADGVTVIVEWDDHALPSLLLWLSDRALTAPPWRGRYRGLGVEPVASAFDLGADVSTSANPLSRAGLRTWVSLEASTTWHTEHAVEVMI